MGLDIYAGTLTRYYLGNWKTKTQQTAEANNMTYHVIRPSEDGEDEDQITDPDTIREAMEQWSSWIANALSAPDYPPVLLWEENNSKDYYTDKPDWCAFGALLLYGACKRYGLELPGMIQRDWTFADDPVVSRALEDPDFNWSLYSSADWWLPFEPCLKFNCQSPNGAEICMATTGLLLAELKKMNEMGWEADEETILGWTQAEGYPEEGSFQDGRWIQGEVHKEYQVESLAKFAFSILYRAALFSSQNRVPIIMDY